MVLFISKCPSDQSSKIEHALFNDDGPELEQVAHRLYRRKIITSSMELIFKAQGLFCSRMIAVPFYQYKPDDRLRNDPPLIVIDSSIEHVLKNLLHHTNTSNNDFEKRLIFALYGIIQTATGHYQEALNIFEQHSFSIGHYELSELEELFINQIEFEMSFCWAIALEKMKMTPSLSPLPSPSPSPSPSTISPLLFGFFKKVTEKYETCNQKSALCRNLNLLSLFHHGIQIKNINSIESARILRTFLINTSGSNMTFLGNDRFVHALDSFMDSLEAGVRGGDYRSVFEMESIDFTILAPDTITEDVSLCTLLSLALTKGIIPNWLKLVKRLARLQIPQLATEIIRTMTLIRGKADSKSYGLLFLSLLAERKPLEALSIGRIYLEIGGNEECIIKAFHLASILSSPSINGHYSPFWKIVQLIKSGKLTKAQECLAQAITFTPTFDLSHSNPNSNSISNSTSTFNPQSSSSFNLHLNGNGSDYRIWYLMALVKAGKGDYEQALMICDQAIKSHLGPPNFFLSMLKSELLSLLGSFEMALEVMRAIHIVWIRGLELETEEGNLNQGIPIIGDGGGLLVIPTPIPISSSHHHHHHHHGNSSLILNSKSSSSSSSTNISRNTNAFASKFDIEGEERRLLDNSSKEDNLVEWLRQAFLRTSSRNLIAIDIWISISRLYMNNSMYGDSQAAIEQAIKINPNHPLVLEQIGRLLEKMGNRHDAISFLEEAALEDNKDGEMGIGMETTIKNNRNNNLASMASIYWKLDNKELAEHYCKIALHHDSNNYEALSIMAKITNEIEWYERALDIESNNIPINNVYLDHVLYPIEFI